MRNNLKYFLVVLLGHYLIYPFYIDSISNTIQQIIIFGSLAAYGFANKEDVFSLFENMGPRIRYLFFAILSYVFVLSATTFIPILYSTMDFSYLYVHIRHILYLLLYILLISLIKKYSRGNNLKDEFIKIYTLTTRNYVLFTILMIVFEPFKDFWLTIIHETPKRLEILENPSYFARIGWAGYSGFSMTFFCSLAVLFSIYIIIKSLKNTNNIPYKEVFNLLLALIGNAFYGRSGLLISLLLIGIGIIYISFVLRKIHYAIYLLTGILIVFLFLTILKEFNTTLASWYSWMMQPIVSLFESGRIETTSTDTLWEMWFIPDFPTLLLGNGYYTSPIYGSYYMGTDVGFIRPTLFFGIAFSFLTYLIPIILSFGIGLRSKVDRVFAMMLIITLLVFEVKAEVVLLLMPLIFTMYIAEYATSSKDIIDGNLTNDRRISTKGIFN